MEEDLTTRQDTIATNAVATRHVDISVVRVKDGFANNAISTSASVVPPKVRLRSCLFQFNFVFAILCVASMVLVCFGFLGGFFCKRLVSHFSHFIAWFFAALGFIC